MHPGPAAVIQHPLLSVESVSRVSCRKCTSVGNQAEVTSPARDPSIITRVGAIADLRLVGECMIKMPLTLPRNIRPSKHASFGPKPILGLYQVLAVGTQCH